MKRIKLSLLVIASVLAVFVTSAFLDKEEATAKIKKPVTEYYFYLDSSSEADENDPDKWVFDDETTPTTGCTGIKVLCTVKAPAVWDGTKYIIDESELADPIDMRNDIAVTDHEYKLFP